jgi:hypothetical protein
MPNTPHRPASWVYAALFTAIATYHFFVLLDSEMVHTIAMRHLVFCLIDAAFAVLVWLWPRWLLLPVGVLTVEQFHAHAGHVWSLWNDGRQISWLGLLTLTGLATLVCVLLLDEYKRLRT